VAADVDYITRQLTVLPYSVCNTHCLMLSQKIPVQEIFFREWEKFSGPRKFDSC